MASFDGFRPRRTLIAGGAAAVFVMGMLFGCMAYMAFFPEEDVPLQQAELGATPAPAEQMGDGAPQQVDGERTVLVLDTTKVEWITAFQSCGHESVESDTESAVGMTLEEVEATYPDYDVRLFTSARVKLKREREGWCPEHYLLTLERGKVCIKRTDPDTLLPYVVMELAVTADSLSAATLTELEEGIAFDSLAQVDAFFENIES